MTYYKAESRILKVAISCLSISVLLVCAFAATLAAAEKPKRALKNNMIEAYHQVPDQAETFTEALSMRSFGTNLLVYQAWRPRFESGWSTQTAPRPAQILHTMKYALNSITWSSATSS